jgi:translocation and assembly module TamA
VTSRRADLSALPSPRQSPRTLLGALLASTVLVGLAAGPAGAFEIFGFSFFGSDEEEEVSPDAQPYQIEVTVASEDETLLDRVQSSSLLYTEREGTPPPSTPAFLSRVRAEYGRIVGGLYAEGYYGPVVTITVDGRDPETIAADAVLPDPVDVAVAVDPGPRFSFGQVAIANQAPPTSDPDDVPENTPQSLGLEQGSVARSGIVLQSERALIEAWREQGYPLAQIAERDAVADHPSSTLDVSIDVAPGAPAVYGPIGVTGTESMNPDFVRRQSGLQPGQPFDPDDLQRARDQLQRLQVFSAVRVVEAGAVNPDGTLPMTLNVAERPLRVVGGGASYSTVDGAGVEAYWEHRNLFGQAERIRLEGRVGGISGIDPNDLSFLAGATFVKPGIITPMTDLTASLIGRRDVFESYEEEVVQGRLGLSHEFFDGLTGTIAGNVEYSHTFDAIGDREFVFASLPGTIVYDGRNNELEPTGGFRASLALEPFYEIRYGNTGVIADLEGSTYFGFGANDRFVIAARAAIGSIVGAPRDEIPGGRLFFAGGGGSIRGYAYRNVGPEVNGEIVGGRSYIEGSLEFRVRVTETIGVVPFIDVGSAYTSSIPDFSEDLRVGVGLGLRYQTGIGAIRVDAAVPLNPGDDDPAFALYIGLGQSF